MEMTSRRGPFNRSVRELNNKNNLASLKLKKELVGFDREKKFLIEHIEKNRVDTFTFLKQLQVCESNLVPAYKELLQGIITRPSMRRRKRKAHTAPSVQGNSNTDNKNDDPDEEQKQRPPVPKFTTAQIKLLQSRTKYVSNQDRAEIFLKKLRERQREEMEEEAEDTQEPEFIMSRKLSRLIAIAAEDSDYSGDRWARPRGSAFQSIGRASCITSRHRPSELLENSLPALSHAVPELAPIRTKDARVISPTEEDCFGRPVRKRPLDLRLREFYDKLDILKKKQDERMADLPIWEKRRRWILLTKGLGAALAESDTESEDDMERSGYY